MSSYKSNTVKKSSKRFCCLVIVPGHAIYLGNTKSDIGNQKVWKGLHINEQEIALYIEHIRKGAQLAQEKNAVLIFSGGQTKKQTQLSEAQGYKALARQIGITKHISVDLEPYARDSFENLLFSIYRFKEEYNAFPTSVMVVGFGFKKERFKFHFETILNNKYALQLPEFDSSFEYFPVNDPIPEVLSKSVAAEKRTLQAFKKLPLGNHGFLLEKKKARNPWCVRIPYPDYIRIEMG